MQILPNLAGFGLLLTSVAISANGMVWLAGEARLGWHGKARQGWLAGEARMGMGGMAWLAGEVGRRGKSRQGLGGWLAGRAWPGREG